MILPFPMGAASPFRSCERDLLGEPGDSHTVKGSVLRISNFPAWRRNFSSSLDKRLNCSLWVRHFSSSSRTLACEGEEESGGKKEGGQEEEKHGGNGRESHEENQAWLNSWAHGQAQSSYTANNNEVNTIEQGWMYMCSSHFKRNIPGMSETAARFHIPVTCTPTRTDTTEWNHTQFKILSSRPSYTS